MGVAQRGEKTESLASHPSHLATNVDQRGETKGERGVPRQLPGGVTRLPGQPSEAPGVGASKPGYREDPAPIGSPIGESLQESMPDSRAEPVTIARLVTGTAVHQGCETVVHADIHRFLPRPRGDLPCQAVGATVPGRWVFPNVGEQATPNDSDHSAAARQIV